LKRIVFFTLLVIITAALISGCNSDNNKEDEPMITLSIDDIKSDPLAFTGKLKINGVVAYLSPDDTTMFGIKDTAELLACKNLYCDAFMLPIRYTDEQLSFELADEIDVIGTWVDIEGGVIFEAEKIEIKRNIMRFLWDTVGNP